MEAACPVFDDRPAGDVIADFVERYLSWVITNRREATILYGARPAMQSADTSQAEEATFKPVEAWMIGRMARRDVRPVPLDLVDPVAFGPVHETCRRWLAHPDHIDLAAASPEVAAAVTAVLV